MIVKKLYFLDRNAVNCIKRANSGEKADDPKKSNLLCQLRRLDKKGYLVSPLLSIIEGEHGRPDSAEEKTKCLRKEANALKEFYKKARTDSDFLLENASCTGDIFSNNHADSLPIREKFLQRTLPCLSKTLPKAERAKVEQGILQCASEIGLQLADPAVMIALMALYGGKSARKVLKPNEPNFHNILSDIYVISWVGFVQAYIKKAGYHFPVKFVTADEGLDEIIRGIHILDSTLQEIPDGIEVYNQIQYSPALFDELTKNDVEALWKRIYTFQVSGCLSARANGGESIA